MEATNTPDLLLEAYGAVSRALQDVDEHHSWSPTGCRGWAVRDLTFHLLGDARRALVALHTPAAEPPDRDAASYWQDWAPDEQGSAVGRRHVRVGASMFLVWDQLRELYLETVLAVLDAADHATLTAAVRTQGHVLSVEDLLSTLCVEATIHHLDLTVHLPGASAPPDTALREVRRVLDGLFGEPVATGWSDERYARVATGRAVPDEQEVRDLGALRDRLPVFS